jgi:hypothetical protein
MSEKPYTYTQGEFWGGKELPKWIFLLFTAFPLTGFFGIDHLLYHSPRTALMKAIVNLFTLGSWYIYDILQQFGDKEKVQSYGLTIPVLGASAIGYGLLGEEEATQTFLKPISFLGYVLFLMIPFGISSFLIGDTKGGLAKVLATFWVLPLFFWTLYEIFFLFYKPSDLFTKGAPRAFPFTLFMDSHGFAPRVMTPDAVKEHEKAAEAEANQPGFFGKIITSIFSFFGLSSPADLLDTAKCVVVPPVQQTVGAAMTAAEGVAGLAATVPAIATKATETITAFSDPQKLQEIAKKQTGGGVFDDTGALDSIFWIALISLFLGGMAIAGIRKFQKQSEHTRNKDDSPNFRNDSPPNPRSV